MPEQPESTLESLPALLSSQARYYLSTSRTPDGLLSARLVGFSSAEWEALQPLLAQVGFRPY